MTHPRCFVRTYGAGLAAWMLLACFARCAPPPSPALQRDSASAVVHLRSGLRAHLGPELFARIARAPYLDDTRAQTLPADELALRIVRGLLTSRRGSLPAWLEDGLCQYLTMHLHRWKDKKWDQRAEVCARIAWDDPGLRAELLARAGDATLDADLSRASLGLVLALESEIGSGNLIELLKRVFVESPETDDEVRRLLEVGAGKPIQEVGHLPGEVRDRLRARWPRGCGKAVALTAHLDGGRRTRSLRPECRVGRGTSARNAGQKEWRFWWRGSPAVQARR